MKNRLSAIIILLLPVLAWGHTAEKANTVSPVKPAQKITPAALQQSPQPLLFLENKGQVTDQYGTQRKDIDIKLQAGRVNIFIGDGQMHYQWNKSTPYPPEGGILDNTSSLSGEDRRGFETYRMDVVLVGANANAEIIKEDKQEYFEQYYLPQCPGGAKAHSYQKITYRNIYPNIDWVLYTASPSGDGRGSHLKYDFVVHPGGNPADIKLRYEGATLLGIEEGALTASTPFGSIKEQAPFSYQLNGKEKIKNKKEVSSAFILEGNILRFDISDWDKTKTLVIDPVLKWATYYGGSSSDHISDMVLDDKGNIYTSGSTGSTNNIATSGAHQQTLVTGGYDDGFLLKCTAGGSRLWATYYGGSSNDGFGKIAYDTSGYIYLVGGTRSTNGIASPGAHQGNLASVTDDAILIKFDTVGTFQWGTYYGGTAHESGNAVCVDAGGNVYIAGQTASSSGIATPGSHLSTYPQPGGAGFIAKFNRSGVRQWGSYHLGVVHTMTCDATGNIIYLGGYSNIPGLATTGAYKTTISGVQSDGFVAKFNSSGVQQWATYVGGTGGDFINCMAIAPLGNIYIAGSSNNIIPTPAWVHQPAFGGGYDDGIIYVFNPVGNYLWSSYYGGNESDKILDIAVDSTNFYITGTTQSPNNIATSAGFQPGFIGNTNNENAFLAIFKLSGIRLWATYYGNSGTIGSRGHACAVNETIRNIYMAGHSSSSLPVTSGSHQPIFGGGGLDAFIASFEQFDTVVEVNYATVDSFWCAGDTVKVGYELSCKFRPGNVFTVQLSNISGSFANPVNIGSKATNKVDTIKCVVPSNITGSGYRVRIVATGPSTMSANDTEDIKIFTYAPAVTNSTAVLCEEDTLYLKVTTPIGLLYNWAGPNGFSSAAEDTFIANTPVNASGDYVVTVNKDGCKTKDTIVVQVNPKPVKPVAGSNSPVCAAGIIKLTANSNTAGISYNWVKGMYASGLQNPAISNAQLTDAGNYVVTATLGSCSGSDTTTVVVNKGPEVLTYPNPGDTICPGWDVSFVAVPKNTGGTPTYAWYKNGVATGGMATSYKATGVSDGDSFYVLMTAGSACNTPISSKPLRITVLPVHTPPTISISSNLGTHVWPYVEVKFKASTGNSGVHPGYQWTRNGKDIPTANDSTWGATDLKTGDTICCVVTSNFLCAVPREVMSNCIVMNVDLSIEEQGVRNRVRLYPNPNDGSFTLETPEPGILYISNLQGQSIGEYKVQKGKNSIELPQGVADGIYMGRFGDSAIRINVMR